MAETPSLTTDPTAAGDGVQCDSPSGLTSEDGRLLLDLAELAIRACVEGTTYPGPDVTRLPQRIRRPCCAFVTLHRDRDFYGCDGGFGDVAPIGECVPKFAIGATLEHGARLRRCDLERMHLQVSIVDRRIGIPAHSRAEVLSMVRPGADGLSIVATSRSAVFLPGVWKFRTDPDDFLDRLLERAGVDPSTWPDDIEVERLETTDFGRFLR